MAVEPGADQIFARRSRVRVIPSLRISRESTFPASFPVLDDETAAMTPAKAVTTITCRTVNCPRRLAMTVAPGGLD